MNPVKNIPQSHSDASFWKQWHVQLKNTFGKKTAATIFISAWNKRGNKNIITHDLNEYLQENDIVLDNDMLGTVLEAGSDYLDGISDILKVGKYAVIGIVGIAVLGSAILVFQVVKNPIKSAQAAAAFTPAGKTAALASAVK